MAHHINAVILPARKSADLYCVPGRQPAGIYLNAAQWDSHCGCTNDDASGHADTDGFIACGMIRAQDGTHVVIASSGGGGHIYTLNMANDSLVDRGTLGAASWHSFNMLPDGSLGFGTSPLSDELVVIDLTTQPVTKKGVIQLVPIRGNAANQPDALGGGDPIVDNILPVSLRAAGQLAPIDVTNLNVKVCISISSPTPFDPGTCNGCAIHGVSVRP